MKYHQCVSCNYNVTDEDSYCPNCGLYKPLESIDLTKKKDVDSGKIAEILLYIVGIAVFVPCIIYFGGEAGGSGILCCAIPVGIVLFIILYMFSAGIASFVMLIYTGIANIFVDKKNQEIDERKAPNPESFKFKEDLIKNRKSELANREEKIVGVFEKAKLNSDEKWQKVCAVLRDSLKTLERQEAKYNLKGIEINVVRLQNKLAPFVYETEGLSYKEIESNLKIIEAAKSHAESLESEVNKQAQVLNYSTEVSELNQRIDDIKKSIQKMYDAFLGRQAVMALKEIKTLDDLLNPVLPPIKAIKESEVFNTQVAITEFYSSFKELEMEYMRIQAEEDISKQVDKIINESNKLV